jgi:hypothetical protein
MEAQKPGNGSRGAQEASIECQCEFCQGHGEFQARLCALLEDLAEILIVCIQSDDTGASVKAYNVVCSHVDAVFTAAREQMEIQQDPGRLH